MSHNFKGHGGVVKKEKHTTAEASRHGSTSTSHRGHARTGTGTGTGSHNLGARDFSPVIKVKVEDDTQEHKYLPNTQAANQVEDIGKIDYDACYREAETRDAASGPTYIDNRKECLLNQADDAEWFYRLQVKDEGIKLGPEEDDYAERMRVGVMTAKSLIEDVECKTRGDIDKADSELRLHKETIDRFMAWIKERTG